MPIVRKLPIPKPPFIAGLVPVSTGLGNAIWQTFSNAVPTYTTYSTLPDPALHTGELVYITTSTGIYLVNRKQAGFYRSNGITWTYGGELVYDIYNEIHGDVIPDLACDTAVNVGDLVYLAADSLLKSAIATSITTSQVVGICDAKTSPGACNLRISGLSGAYLTGLIPGSKYFLSESVLGGLSPTAATSLGAVVVEIGVARTSDTLTISPQILLIRA